MKALCHFCCLGLLVLLATSTPIVLFAAESPFRVEKLTDGIYLYRPDDADYTRTNSMVVERSDGLLVVDAQPTPEAARELLAEIARRHSAPVRYLVYSHDHTESVGGGSAFPASTLVIASEGTQAALKDPATELGAEVQARAADPTAWKEPERRFAGLVVRGAAVLDDPLHPVELLVLGRPAHAAGDMMLSMAHVKLYHVGGLLFTDRNPYARDANVGYWLGAFNHLIGDRPDFIVGLRGPSLDRKELMNQRSALNWLRGQIEEGFINMLPLNQIEDRVLVTKGIEERFDVNAEPSFLPILINVCVEESADGRRKRGRPFKERESLAPTESP